VYHVFSKLLGQWRGRSVYLGDRVPWPSDLNVESLPHPGPTVSNVALSTAMEMGFERVILAGVDLCHSKDGYSHAIGSNERFAGPHLGKVCIRVDTYGGWTAETTSDFAPAIAILDVQAKTCLERGVRLINPAPGAARIEHIEHIPLEEIILEPGMRSAAEIFREVLPEITTQYRLNYYKKAIKEISRVLGQLIQIHKLSVEAIRCNDGLFGRRGMKRDFKHKKRMDKIEKTLNSKHDKFSRLVKTFGIRNFLKLTRIDRDKEWDDAEIEKTGRAYYQAYRDSASSLIDMVRQSRDRLEMRVEEEKESPRMELLFKQWSKDEQPGRILVWLARRGLKIEDLDPEQRSSAEKLLADFTQMNSQTDTEHMRRSRSFADLGGVRAKTLAFFRQNNFSGLRDLKEALAAHPDPKAEKFVHLCEGYLAEMAGNNDKALEHYQLLFDEQDESLLEDILRRITSITLTRNDVDNSTLALESLCHISPTYLPQYGDFLRLIGSHQEAIGAYLFYLEQIPFDTAMMLKVGAYYRELNMEEGARAMFEHILQREPDNNRARRLLAGE
ncbi:MAG: DUF115 domain-containing protein, partial [Desulfobulbaceae bacterium]|nr:DUF115 domain-containing protein [Desulfobulbaceae bacterium]